MADILLNNIAPAEPDCVWQGDSVCYTLRTKKYSHWQHNEDGSIKFISQTMAATQDSWKSFDVRFDSKNTAIMIMDPWINCPDEVLNEYYGKITRDKIIPLVLAAEKSGHHIIVLSDSPDNPYNSKIPPEIQELVDKGRAELFVHGQMRLTDFKEYALSKGIDKFIYTGFCSNICILLRELGIPNVSRLGIGETFFIPDAAAAMEHADTWESQDIHKASSFIISQDMAPLIEYYDIMKAITK